MFRLIGRFWLLVLGVVFGLAAFDEIKVSLASGDTPVAYSIEQIEQGEIKDRFVSISGGIFLDAFYYEYDKENNNLKEVIVPLVSQKVEQAVIAKENPAVSVFVKIPAKGKLADVEKWFVTNVLSQGGVPVRGVIAGGVSDVMDKSMFDSGDFSIPEQVTILEKDKVPSTSLGIFFGVIALVTTVLGLKPRKR